MCSTRKTSLTSIYNPHYLFIKVLTQNAPYHGYQKVILGKSRDLRYDLTHKKTTEDNWNDIFILPVVLDDDSCGGTN